MAEDIRRSIACAAFVIGVVAATPTRAQVDQQVDWCKNKGGNVSLDLRINGCTAVIQSGRWSGKNLTWAFVNRANAYDDNNQSDRAIADYDQAAELDPTDASVYANRGLAYRRRGDTDRAIADYNMALRINPQYGYAYNLRGSAYLNKKDYDRAVADYSRSIQLVPKETDTFYNRGLAYKAKGDFDNAIADFSRAIAGYTPAKYSPAYKRDYFKQRGDAYKAKNSYDQAIADYSEAIAIDGKFARAFFNRSEAKRSNNDAAGADADLARAKELQADIGAEN